MVYRTISDCLGEPPDSALSINSRLINISLHRFEDVLAILISNSIL